MTLYKGGYRNTVCTPHPRPRGASGPAWHRPGLARPLLLPAWRPVGRGTWTPPEGTIALLELVNRYTESQGDLIFFLFFFVFFFFFFFPLFSFSVLIRMGYSTTVSPTQCQYTCSRGLLDSQLQLYKCTQENLPCYPPPTDWGSNCTFLLTMTGESKQWNRIMGELSHFPSCFHWFVHTILIIMKGLCV